MSGADDTQRTKPLLSAAELGARDGKKFSMNLANRLLIAATGWELFCRHMGEGTLASVNAEEYGTAFLRAAGGEDIQEPV
jgi:hypothetical protein